MSITLSRVTYETIGSISCGMADFLDTLVTDSTPTRLYLNRADDNRVQRMKDFAVKSPDDAGMIEFMLEEMEKTGEIDFAWG
jgi:hypothetical protein